MRIIHLVFMTHTDSRLLLRKKDRRGDARATVTHVVDLRPVHARERARHDGLPGVRRGAACICVSHKN